MPEAMLPTMLVPMFQAISSPHAALAARSGGRIGGSSFSSARSSLGSSGSNSYSGRAYGSSG